jgi:hypothetical protein
MGLPANEQHSTSKKAQQPSAFKRKITGALQLLLNQL